ncbi:MAG: outer membrane protein assembly factor BamD [Candidatus Coatesbacteria bacterium]|nr:outer membrane protein assembly factor BamD [Candidatus Coatesbacteria bacterium]
MTAKMNNKGFLGALKASQIAAILALLISFLCLSCASNEGVVLDDDEMYHLAIRKLEEEEDAGIAAALVAPKKRKEAKELLDEMLDKYPSSRYAKEAQMRLADLWLSEDKFEEAEAEYSTILRFYPSDKDAEKAMFRLLLTHHRRIRTYDRDQSPTHKTLKMVDDYRKRYPNGEFTELVAIIEEESIEMLASHEFYVGRLYYRQKAYAAASSRLKGVISDYPDTEAACKALLYLAKLDVKLERLDEAIENLERLIDEYPGCHSVAAAEGMLEELREGR